jgi:hypothetical protein
VFNGKQVASEIKKLGNMNQILILVLLQIWLDLSESA